MAAIVFPPTPLFGDVYPAGSGTPGVSQWRYDGKKWNIVPVFLRTNNQLADNDYVWPTLGATAPGSQLTDVLGDGDLSWEFPGGTLFYLDDISSQFNGVLLSFTLRQGGLPFLPDPSSNIIVALNGLVLTYGTSYTVVGNQLVFTGPPAPGTTFCAISNREL